QPSSSPLFPYTTLFRSDRDRGRDQVGVFERVVGDAEGRQPAEGLDAQFDQVGGVFVVSVTARVVIGPVWGREEVAPAGVAPGRVDRKSTRLNSSHRTIS